MEAAKFSLLAPKVVATHKFMRETIDKNMKSLLNSGDQLSDVCLRLIKTYINLVKDFMPTFETSTKKLLRKYPDGFRIDEN